MTECRYRNVEIHGDLVSGEEYHGAPVDDWVKFRGSEQLMKVHLACTDPGTLLKIWSHQDGMPGVTLEEYDWSALRDSSEFAIYAMLAEAEDWWQDRGLWPWQLLEIQK